MTSNDSLDQLARVLESRKVGDPDSSYTARLLHKGPDAFLKKIGEEATELVMACKDADYGGDKSKIVSETADLWFHSMVALAHYGLSPYGASLGLAAVFHHFVELPFQRGAMGEIEARA